MTGSESSRNQPREINERPSSIVCIAYHQLSVMCGIRDPTLPTDVTPVTALETNGSDMVCIRRFLSLPIFTSLTSALCNAYGVAKGSHESVASILNYAEDGMRAGFNFVSPITNTVTEALETPLKTVDNAVCVGMDFVEQRIPPMTQSSHQIYVNMKQSIRSIFTSVMDSLRLLFGEPKNRIEDLSSKPAQEKIQEASS